MDGKRLDFDQDKLKVTLAEEPVEVAYLFGNLHEGIEDFEDFADQVVMFMRSIETEQEEESSGVC